MKKTYVTREFTVMSRKDYNTFISDCEFNYKTYTAEYLSDDTIRIKDKIFANHIFHELYTTNLC